MRYFNLHDSLIVETCVNTGEMIVPFKFQSPEIIKSNLPENFKSGCSPKKYQNPLVEISMTKNNVSINFIILEYNLRYT